MCEDTGLTPGGRVLDPSVGSAAPTPRWHLLEDAQCPTAGAQLAAAPEASEAPIALASSVVTRSTRAISQTRPMHQLSRSASVCVRACDLCMHAGSPRGF